MSKAKKKGDKKGKTMALTDYLAAENAPKLVTVKPNNWSDIVDQEMEVKPTVFDVSNLPTAPRGAIDIDYSDVPKNPPFVAHVANLSFEILDEDLRRTFGDLNPKSARVIKDGQRSRGVGFVEFETRENLIEALKRTDKEVFGRKIRVVVSDKTDSHHQDSSTRGFSNRSGPSRGGGEERAEMADSWRRAEPRSDDRFENRGSSGFDRDRDRPNRGDFGRSNASGGQNDGQRSNDYGFGYPRSRDDRGGGGSRDFDRQAPRNRRDDDTRSNSGVDRPRYGGRYSDNRDVRDRDTANDNNQDDRREPPKERPRLQLQPRTKPLEENDALSASSSSVNNVAANVTHTPSTSISNTNGADDSSIQHDQTNEHQENYNDDSSRYDASDPSSPVEQSTTATKPPASSRGAGASIFGGAKPVDTATKELEIERKLKELEISSTTQGENEETTSSSSKPSYSRGSGDRDRDRDRDSYRGNRSLQSDDYQNRDRDRRDDGRYNRGSDHHHKREYSGGRQYEDDSRRRSDDDPYRRSGGGGGGYDRDRDRYSGSSRRDNDSGRTGKYNHHNNQERDNDRPQYRDSNRNYPPRDRDDREGPSTQPRSSGHDSNEFNNPSGQPAPPSNSTYNADPSSRNPQRGGGRRTVPTEDESSRLQLSNKFGMLLDDDDLNADHDEVRSPTTDD